MPAEAEQVVGFVVPVEPIVPVAMEHLVSRKADLFLAREDRYAGLCLELNEPPSGLEYELAAFAPSVSWSQTWPPRDA